MKKVMKIMKSEGTRMYKLSNVWLEIDDENVSIWCLCLLIIIVGTCLSAFLWVVWDFIKSGGKGQKTVQI